jgi:hypothetical protein
MGMGDVYLLTNQLRGICESILFDFKDPLAIH